jgi:hypothetical protein
MNMLELQEKFIEELLKGVRGAWSRIEIHYEYFEWDGDVFENYISKIYQGQAAEHLSLSVDALDVLLDLQQCKPAGQSEQWTWFEFRLDSSGAYEFDYKYGTPPLAAEEMKH